MYIGDEPLSWELSRGNCKRRHRIAWNRDQKIGGKTCTWDTNRQIGRLTAKGSVIGCGDTPDSRDSAPRQNLRGEYRAANLAQRTAVYPRMCYLLTYKIGLVVFVCSNYFIIIPLVIVSVCTFLQSYGMID
uniref:SCP domain-containing protein n=1 Tax=Trichuris muris TaxID=70415 RepID=A0A5S6QX88_TRIMR